LDLAGLAGKVRGDPVKAHVTVPAGSSVFLEYR